MNYGNLKTTIANKIDREDLSTQIAIWIYDARRNIVNGFLPIVAKADQAYHRFSWSYANTTLTTTASTATVDLPSDYIDELDVFHASENTPLVKSSIPELDNAYFANDDSTGTGKPTNYSVLATQVKLHPIPDGVYSLTLHYYAFPETLSDDSDEKTIDKVCPGLIIDLCCYEAAAYLHDEKLQMYFGEAAKNRYFNLVTYDKRRQWTRKDMRMKTFRDFDMSLYKGRKMM